MGDTLSNIGSTLSDAFGWLTGPSAAQQAMLAGRWNDPALAQADRAAALGQSAVDIARASQQGLPAGALLGVLGQGLAGAGLQQMQQRAQIGEALARTGLYGAQTQESQQLLQPRIQQMQAQTGLYGAQTNEITQMLQPRIDQIKAQTGLDNTQAWSLIQKTPAEVRQILTTAGLQEAQ